MKYWEFFSLFRDEQNIIENIFQNDNWKIIQEEYLTSNFDRNILDKKLPIELVLEAARKSNKRYFIHDTNTIRRYSNKVTTNSFSMIEIIEKFGDISLEDVEEKGSIQIKK